MGYPIINYRKRNKFSALEALREFSGPVSAKGNYRPVPFYFDELRQNVSTSLDNFRNGSWRVL